MPTSDIEQILRNWIGQAISPQGSLPSGDDPAKWVAEHFIAWWREHVEEGLSNAEHASQSLRDQLSKLNDPERLGDMFHELTHVQDALFDLRVGLGLNDPEEADR